MDGCIHGVWHLKGGWDDHQVTGRLPRQAKPLPALGAAHLVCRHALTHVIGLRQQDINILNLRHPDVIYTATHSHTIRLFCLFCLKS